MGSGEYDQAVDIYKAEIGQPELDYEEVVESEDFKKWLEDDIGCKYDDLRYFWSTIRKWRTTCRSRFE